MDRRVEIRGGGLRACGVPHDAAGFRPKNGLRDDAGVVDAALGGGAAAQAVDEAGPVVPLPSREASEARRLEQASYRPRRDARRGTRELRVEAEWFVSIFSFRSRQFLPKFKILIFFFF